MTPTQRFTARTGAAILASALILTGIAGCSPAPTASKAQQTQAPVPIALPDTSTGKLADWVITQMNGTSPTDGAELKTRMDPELLKGIKEAELAKILDERQASRNWVPTKVKETTIDDMNVIYVRLQSDSSDAVTVLQISQSRKSKLMAGIYFLAPGAIDFSSK
ncbi:hypothetical protein G7068_12340 [Leucobacter viscericola]|uniref:ORF 12 gene product N-terminal domain-containing protein n=1 Tax=Leucobacter viscericola TaxID=2714935 RepID=A0A6G7XHD9_9MICO|nr:Cpe/LpqF family protein [Leucobacter viscericola]QIK63896.1 hypothetical protein G7068_12340 [Leucobacter viscericola]